METIEMILSELKEMMSSQVALLALSVAMFYIANIIKRYLRSSLLPPVILATGLVIVVLWVTGIDYELYYEANEVINFMLSISVVSFSYLMHRNIKRIKECRLSLLVSTFAGSLVGVLGVLLMARFFGCDEVIIRSIEPKSVTTAIALSLSESEGGVVAITSLAVVVAGIFGSAIGPSVLRLIGVKDSVAVGAALGSASHAVGTARAAELGAVEGAVGGAAICLMGLFTSLLMPIINALLG